MKSFRVEAVAQIELEEAAAWYETKREGLGLELIAEVDRVLVRIAHEEKLRTAPLATVEGASSVANSSSGFGTSSCLSSRMRSGG